MLSHAPRWIALLGGLLLVPSIWHLGCSSGSGSSSTTVGPAPAGTLACSTQQNTCKCAVAANKSGTCSPQSLGGTAHCCATVDRLGATTICSCDATRIVCKSDPGGASCRCAADDGAPGGLVQACSPPSAGHCCQARGASMCTCGAPACNADTTEVASCTPASTIPPCSSPAFEVTSCQ